MMPHIHQENMKMIIIHIMSYASKMELGKKKEVRESSNCEVMGNLMIVIFFNL